MLLKISYRNKIYYIDQDSIYDLKLNKLSTSSVKQLGFSSILEAHILFKKLASQALPKSQYCGESYMHQLIRQNLSIDEQTNLPHRLSEDILKNINYAVVKVTDTKEILRLLEKIRSTHNLVYRKLTLENPPTKDLKQLKKHLYEPYATVQKNQVSTIAFLLPLVFKF